MALITVLGMDPSLNNWGYALGTYSTTTQLLDITHLETLRPTPLQGKQVRQNSKDISVAEQHSAAVTRAARKAQAVFVEVPVGSQSARAMASYGICVGVLGAFQAAGTPFFQVTPLEVKLASVGKKTATKDEMIQWAMDLAPNAPWPYYKKNGVEELSRAQAEHMADAIAAIYAGTQLPDFQQLIRLSA